MSKLTDLLNQMMTEYQQKYGIRVIREDEEKKEPSRSPTDDASGGESKSQSTPKAKTEPAEQPGDVMNRVLSRMDSRPSEPKEKPGDAMDRVLSRMEFRKSKLDPQLTKAPSTGTSMVHKPQNNGDELDFSNTQNYFPDASKPTSMNMPDGSTYDWTQPRRRDYSNRLAVHWRRPLDNRRGPHLPPPPNALPEKPLSPEEHWAVDTDNSLDGWDGKFNDYVTDRQKANLIGQENPELFPNHPMNHHLIDPWFVDMMRDDPKFKEQIRNAIKLGKIPNPREDRSAFVNFVRKIGHKMFPNHIGEIKTMKLSEILAQINEDGDGWYSPTLKKSSPKEEPTPKPEIKNAPAQPTVNRPSVAPPVAKPAPAPAPTPVQPPRLEPGDVSVLPDEMSVMPDHDWYSTVLNRRVNPNSDQRDALNYMAAHLAKLNYMNKLENVDPTVAEDTDQSQKDENVKLAVNQFETTNPVNRSASNMKLTEILKQLLEAEEKKNPSGPPTDDGASGGESKSKPTPTVKTDVSPNPVLPKAPSMPGQESNDRMRHLAQSPHKVVTPADKEFATKLVNQTTGDGELSPDQVPDPFTAPQLSPGIDGASEYDPRTPEGRFRMQNVLNLVKDHPVEYNKWINFFKTGHMQNSNDPYKHSHNENVELTTENVRFNSMMKHWGFGKK
jgi:hypothetical protein